MPQPADATPPQAAYDRAVRLMERRLRRRITDQSPRTASGVSAALDLSELAFVQMVGLARPGTIARLLTAQRQQDIQDPLQGADETDAVFLMPLQCDAAPISAQQQALDTLITDTFRSITEELRQPAARRLPASTGSQAHDPSLAKAASRADTGAGMRDTQPPLGDARPAVPPPKPFREGLSEAEKFLRALEARHDAAGETTIG